MGSSGMITALYTDARAWDADNIAGSVWAANAAAPRAACAAFNVQLTQMLLAAGQDSQKEAN